MNFFMMNVLLSVGLKWLAVFVSVDVFSHPVILFRTARRDLLFPGKQVGGERKKLAGARYFAR
jgi:hypothetical protein